MTKRNLQGQHGDALWTASHSSLSTREFKTTSNLLTKRRSKNLLRKCLKKGVKQIISLLPSSQTKLLTIVNTKRLQESTLINCGKSSFSIRLVQIQATNNLRK